jgi:hypothetical protein
MYAGRLSAVLNSKVEYLNQLQVIYTAVEDLAARLRVSKDEIRFVTIEPLPTDEGDFREGSIYRVTLERPFGEDVINEASGLYQSRPGQINPQPYGRYTYTIAVNDPDRIGVAHIQILRLTYFDGSYDEYRYQWGLFIGWIEQYDNNNVHKATISYLNENGLPNTRIQTITHYKYDESVQYTDYYSYGMDDDSPMVTWTITVERKKGVVPNPEVGLLICTFTYVGTIEGQERLDNCVFPDGMYIDYLNDLAQEVWDGNADSNQSIMHFEYLDENGQPTVFNIATTVVYYSDNRLPVAYPGLADPVDIVVNSSMILNDEVSDKLTVEETAQNQPNIPGVTLTSTMVTNNSTEELLASQVN